MTPTVGELSELYQEILLDHAKTPHHYGKIEGAPSAEGFNPLCGDKVCVFVQKDEHNRIHDVRFEAHACFICTASASLMSDAMENQTLHDASHIVSAFRILLQTGNLDRRFLQEELEALGGIHRFPARLKCALLPWMTFVEAAGIEKDEKERSS